MKNAEEAQLKEEWVTPPPKSEAEEEKGTEESQWAGQESVRTTFTFNWITKIFLSVAKIKSFSCFVNRQADMEALLNERQVNNMP